MEHETFHLNLKKKMDEFAHLVYKVTRKFSKEEIYGITSQLRRAALSVILNYVEGYARQKSKVYKNFLEISYGSLKECKYLMRFSFEEKYIEVSDYKAATVLADEIGAMLWGIMRRL